MNCGGGWTVHHSQMLGDLLDMAHAIGFVVDIADAARWFWRHLRPAR